MINRCIFCLSITEIFTSIEHIIPESLGNNKLILPIGYVCDKCNHEILSTLDNILLKFEPISFLKVQYVPYTKKGKLSKAIFQNLVIQSTSPESLMLIPQDRTGKIQNKKEIGDGWISFEIKMQGKIFQPKEIAKALYKVGFGMVAYAKGHDYACNPKFDLARDFIFGRGGFENNMLMRLNIKPQLKSQITVQDKEKEGLIVYFNFYGFWIIINLMPEPKLKINEQLRILGFNEYNLSN